MNYNDLKKANATIQMKPIKGKQYAETKERIKAFRQLFPEGFIRTKIIEKDEKGVLMQAEAGHFVAIMDKDGSVVDFQEAILGTGHAFEFLAKNRNINSTSMIENCETSAIGRALASVGIGIDVSFASYEEVNSAVYAQAAEAPVEPVPETDAEKKAAGEEFVGFCTKNNINAALAAKHFGLRGKCAAKQTLAALASLKEFVNAGTIPAEWRVG